MAEEIENLEIIIDVVSHVDELLQLIGELETLEKIAESLGDIDIRVNVHDRQLDTLMAKLAAANFMGLDIGGGGPGIGALGGGQGLSGIAQMDIEDNMVRALDETNSHLASLLVKQDDMLQLFRDRDGGGVFSGRTMRNMSEGFEDTTGILGGLNLRMSDMHNALAKVIPLILLFIGTLPALITAVVALAAAALSAAIALAAIGGIGFLGAVAARSGTGRPTAEAMQEIMSELTDGIIDALLPLGRRFAPLAERALEGIVVLLERVELVAGRALTGLTDDAEAFGRFMMDFLPAALRNMALMAEAFGPVFGMIADFLMTTGFLRPLTEMFARMLPDLIAFMALLGKMLPALIDFSIGMLHVVNVLLAFVGIIMQVVSMTGLSAEEFGVLVGVLFVLISTIAILNTALVKNLLATLAGVTLKTVQTATLSFLQLAGAKIGAAIAAITLANAVKVLTLAVISLLAVSGIGLLLSILGTMTTGFLGTSSAIDKATQSLKSFNRVSGMSGDGFNPYAPPSGVQPGSIGGGSGGNSVTVNVAGDADKEDIDKAARNVLWRMNRGV